MTDLILQSLQGYYANLTQILAERQFKLQCPPFPQVRHFPQASLYVMPKEISIQEQDSLFI